MSALDSAQRVATWLFPPGSRGRYRQPNIQDTAVLINFAAWPLAEGEEREVEVQLLERDAREEGEPEEHLLARVTGTLSTAVHTTEGQEARSFSYVRFTQTDVDDLTGGDDPPPMLLRNAFRLGFHDPALPAGTLPAMSPIHIHGRAEEDGDAAFEVHFKIIEGDQAYRSLDRALRIFENGGECLIDLPVMNQGRRRQRDLDERGEHYPHLDVAPAQSLTDEEFYAEWDACRRPLPVLDTTQDTLTAGTHSLDGIPMETALADHGTDEGRPSLADHTTWVMNPMPHVVDGQTEVDADGDEVYLAEQFGYGACKLTSTALALWAVGAYPRVLRLLLEGDALLDYAGDPAKTYMTITCDSGQLWDTNPDPERTNNRTRCVPRRRQDADPDAPLDCDVCEHADQVTTGQLSPFVLAAYVWWLITSLEGGFRRGDGDFVIGRGNFLLRGESGRRLIRDYFGCELLEDYVSLAPPSGGPQDSAAYRESTHGPRIRSLLTRGVPVLAWVRGGSHVTLIRGCERWTSDAGVEHWLYHFIDPAEGGWTGKALLTRFQFYTAFAPKGFEPGPDHFRDLPREG